MKRLGFLVFGASLLTGCVHGGMNDADLRFSRTFHASVPVNAAQSFRLSNISGTISVEAWGRPELAIDATLHATDRESLDRMTVETRNEGDKIEVASRSDRKRFFNFSFGNEGRIDYVVHAPATLAASIENVSGSVTVQGLAHDLSVHDVSGRIVARDIGGSLDLDTTSGRILATVSNAAPSAHFSLKTVSGSIVLTIPKHTAATVKASSISGDFSSTFSLPSSEQTVGSKVEGSINGGGAASITMSTVSGSIRLSGR